MNIVDLLYRVMGQVWLTLQHNWPFLVVSAFVAAALKLYVNQDGVAAFLRRNQRGSVVAATGAAVLTPFCSCGTTAVVLGLMAGSVPWAPIIAFMVASPLTSPEELFYSAGIFGWPFAWAFFGTSILLGLLGGAAGHFADARGWLRGQARLQASLQANGGSGKRCDCEVDAEPKPSCGCGAGPVIPVAAAATAHAEWQPVYAQSILLTPAPTLACACKPGGASPSARPAPTQRPIMLAMSPVAASACEPAGAVAAPSACGSSCQPASPVQPSGGAKARFDGRALLSEAFVAGGRLLAYFVAFAFVGYLINDLIPATWITALFGSGQTYGIPLAATLGLPFYLNTEASLPLVRGLLDSGMSQGAALAFLVTGAGTSIGAIAGGMTIARWRVIGIVVATLWLGAVLCGFAWDALLLAGVI